MKRIIPLTMALVLMLASSIFGVLPQVQADEPVTSNQVTVYLFWGEGCPYCHMEIAFLDELLEKYPNMAVQDYEVFNHPENRPYMARMLAEHGVQSTGVPVTFIGDRYWIGFNDVIGRQIEAKIVTCLETTCNDPGIGILPAVETAPPPSPIISEVPVGGAEDGYIISIPLLGEVSLAGQSLWFSTALIAFVDGFNPCSLWVLSILLGLVIHSGSRKKIFIVGITFLTVTALVYGFFIGGLFTIFSFVGFIGWIQIAVALLALGFAVINIKDYFWYKQGVSLTIAERHKPGIYRNMRSIMQGDKSTLALIGATVAMALGIALVELPCTSGFPVLWTNLLASQGVDGATFLALLSLYILIYLADELLIFFGVVLTLKASKFEEKHGRVLKLVGGVIMMALAIVLIIDPAIMNDIGSSLMVFGGALLLTVVVLLVHRKVLPSYGIYIGTEMQPPSKRNKRRRHA